jgi:hypothetical protein
MQLLVQIRPLHFREAEEAASGETRIHAEYARLVVQKHGHLLRTSGPGAFVFSRNGCHC